MASPTIPVRTEYPRRVREIENVWIPMPDGVRLAARIWLPEDAGDDPVPAVLEYLPYRKRDGTVERDAQHHPYIAGFGYAGVRVDMRGTGDSEGVCLGEYLQQEQDDGVAVIEWLAAQDWCSGTVGMIGISWGGFNGLQIAARRPPALKAVISLCSTDDRFADDIHSMGGAQLTENLAWGGTAFAIAHTPPDPAIVGPRWREMWRERLESNGLWLIDWLRHQRRDGFWRHGSICEDYAQVEVPVYAVGGWADGYTNPIFRMMEHLPGPKRALIGPWAHRYPHIAEPGPRIGFLQECLRWWDQHLKGIDTGIMDEPMIRAFIQDPAPPAPHYAERTGRWVAEPGWPPEGRSELSLVLSPGRLGAGEGAVSVAAPETAGRYGQVWCTYGYGHDQALDQSREDGAMCVLISDPLEEDLEILGFPVIEAEVISDQPLANLSAVLSARDPDGTATQVSFGVLNLTHRRSAAEPEPMVPGQAARIRLQLNVAGQRFARGQRISLALSTANWPMIWPGPERVRLSLAPGARLVLPVRAPAPGDAALAAFPPPEGAAPFRSERDGKAREERTVTEDLITGREVSRRFSDSGEARHLGSGLTVRQVEDLQLEILPGDPLSARGSSRWLKSYARGDWRAEVETEVTIAAGRDAWHLTGRLIAREGGAEIFAKNWDETIPRDLV